MGNASHLAALMLLFGAATADAQVTPPATAAGSYQQLSTGNQKIARALFEAQVQPATTASRSATTSGTTGSTSAAQTLTLDQIAAMKQQGTGWGQVFKTMHTQGLITEKNLGQVVSRYNAAHTSPSASVAHDKGGRGDAAEAGRPGASLAGSHGQDRVTSARSGGNAYGRSGGTGHSR